MSIIPSSLKDIIKLACCVDSYLMLHLLEGRKGKLYDMNRNAQLKTSVNSQVLNVLKMHLTFYFFVR